MELSRVGEQYQEAVEDKLDKERRRRYEISVHERDKKTKIKVDRVNVPLPKPKSMKVLRPPDFKIKTKTSTPRLHVAQPAQFRLGVIESRKIKLSEKLTLPPKISTETGIDNEIKKLNEVYKNNNDFEKIIALYQYGLLSNPESHWDTNLGVRFGDEFKSYPQIVKTDLANFNIPDITSKVKDAIRQQVEKEYEKKWREDMDSQIVNSKSDFKDLIRLLSFYEKDGKIEKEAFVKGCKLINEYSGHNIPEPKDLLKNGFVFDDSLHAKRWSEFYYKTPIGVKDVLEVVRDRPETFSIEKINLKEEILKLKSDSRFIGFIEWLGNGQEKWVEDYYEQDVISEFDRSYGDSAFKEILSKLLYFEAIKYSHTPSTSRRNRQKSSPEKWHYSITDKAQSVLTQLKIITGEEKATVIEKEKIEQIKGLKEKEILVIDDVIPSLTEEGEEIPDFFDMLFSVNGVGKFGSGEPTLICIEDGDAYIETLRTICTRVLRENVGGKGRQPKFSQITKEFEEEITKWMRGEDNVFTVQLSSEDWDKFNKEKGWDHIEDRLAELPRERFGFIIFNQRIERPLHAPIINTLYIKPRRLNIELHKKISSIAWGFVDVNDTEGSFDYIFDIARNRFEREIKSIGEPYRTATKRHIGGNESDDLHYPLKLFSVKYLAEEMGLGKEIVKINEKIHTEEPYGDFPEEKYPDIYVSRDAEDFNDNVFEVETLFGSGEFPLESRIDETIRKYESKSPIKVNIVLDNLTMLRHMSGLKEKLKIHKELQNKGIRMYEIEFYTLDLKNKSLVSLDKMIEKVRDLKREINTYAG